MTTWGSWGLPREAPPGPLSWSRLLGVAAGLPTRALPQPARWMAPDQTGPQPQYHGHPIRPGVVPPGHQSMVGEGVGCAASAGGSGLTPRTGPTPPSPCKASGCRAAQTRCSGPWWDPSASSGWDLLCTKAEETSLEALHSFCLGLGVAASSLANGWLLGPTHGEWRKKTKPPSPGVEVSGAEVGSLQSL